MIQSTPINFVDENPLRESGQITPVYLSRIRDVGLIDVVHISHLIELVKIYGVYLIYLIEMTAINFVYLTHLSKPQVSSCEYIATRGKSSIGFSPLSTSHPIAFKRYPVRSSMSRLK